MLNADRKDERDIFLDVIQEDKGTKILDARQIEARNRMIKVARYFLLHQELSIEQLSVDTGVSRATAYRYLNNQSLMFAGEELGDLCGEENPYNLIQSLLRKFDEKERKEKVLRVTKYILENRNATIQQISDYTKIPVSSVQRYLNEDAIDEMLKDIGIDKPSEIIQQILVNNKQQAAIRGGNSFAANNISTKDELGKFTGSKKK